MIKFSRLNEHANLEMTWPKPLRSKLQHSLEVGDNTVVPTEMNNSHLKRNWAVTAEENLGTW